MKEIPTFYGKKITELTSDEKTLLHIDTMLVMSFRMRENGNSLNIGIIQLGTDDSIEYLSDLRWKQSLIVLGMDSNTKCTREVGQRIEKTPYGFQMFMRDYMKLGNTISEFIDEKMVEKEDELKRICLN